MQRLADSALVSSVLKAARSTISRMIRCYYPVSVYSKDSRQNAVRNYESCGVAETEPVFAKTWGGLGADCCWILQQSSRPHASLSKPYDLVPYALLLRPSCHVYSAYGLEPRPPLRRQALVVEPTANKASEPPTSALSASMLVPRAIRHKARPVASSVYLACSRFSGEQVDVTWLDPSSDSNEQHDCIQLRVHTVSDNEDVAIKRQCCTESV
ncbi:hypothetical protein KCU59_g73, partial [Aureobasidium melanogenum]